MTATADPAGFQYDGPVFDERACVRCGCTDDRACTGGCSWAQSDPWICTRCAGLHDEDLYGVAGGVVE